MCLLSLKQVVPDKAGFVEFSTIKGHNLDSECVLQKQVLQLLDDLKSKPEMMKNQQEMMTNLQGLLTSEQSWQQTGFNRWCRLTARSRPSTPRTCRRSRRSLTKHSRS